MKRQIGIGLMMLVCCLGIQAALPAVTLQDMNGKRVEVGALAQSLSRFDRSGAGRSESEASGRRQRMGVSRVA